MRPQAKTLISGKPTKSASNTIIIIYRNYTTHSKTRKERKWIALSGAYGCGYVATMHFAVTILAESNAVFYFVTKLWEFGKGGHMMSMQFSAAPIAQLAGVVVALVNGFAPCSVFWGSAKAIL
jgi:hypothetical protein